MTEHSSIALAILAAGQSRRFGVDDKLRATIAGRALGTIVPETLSGMGWHSAMVISSSADHPCAAKWLALGFAVMANERSHEGMGGSVALAARQAKAAGAQSLLICLADMPHVSTEHIARLIARFDAGPRKNCASTANGKRMPPAIFGQAYFDELCSLQGDTGARSLLANAALVEAPPAELHDIDTPGDLIGNRSPSRK